MDKLRDGIDRNRKETERNKSEMDMLREVIEHQGELIKILTVRFNRLDALLDEAGVIK